MSVSACAAASVACLFLTADASVRARARSQTAADQLVVERAARFARAMVTVEERGLNYVPGEVIVKFKAGMAPAAQQRALMALRSRPAVSDLEWRQGGVAVLHDESQPDAHILAAQLSLQPEVEYAEPNFIATTGPVRRLERGRPTGRPPLRPRGWGVNRVPNDADFIAYQWNLNNLLRMPSAWDIQDGANSSIIVAVLDTGITAAPSTPSFPLWTGSSFEQVVLRFAVNDDLPASRLALPRDFTSSPFGVVVDTDGHGTHVSSTVGEETNNGQLLAGMAYNARIMPVKVCTGYWDVMVARGLAGIPFRASDDAGGCDFIDVADGIRYAVDNGAKVINLSLGGEGQSTALRNALLYAVDNGAFVAISMGNDFEFGNPTHFPARYALDIEGVMAVGAVGPGENRAYYSQTGSHTEIAAPGGDSVAGAGRTDFGVVWQSTLFFPDQDPDILRPRFDRYDGIGYEGTSMASPHVAGLAALIMAQSPGVSPANVEKIIRATAKNLGPAGRDDQFGHGLIQPRATLFGRGIIK